MSAWPDGNRGFTLLEAVVALAVVGLAAVATLGTLGMELRTAARVRRALESQALAEAKLASLRLATRDELEPLADSLREGRFPAPFADYHWDASSRELPGREDVFEVALSVRWDSGMYDVTTRLFRPRPAGRAR